MMNINKAGFNLLEKNKLNSPAGFTFIEMLITLIVMGITFLPLMNMFTGSLAQSQANYEITTARYLAQEGMEKLKNLNLTVEQIKGYGDLWDPPLEEMPYAVDHMRWRILRKIDPQSVPLEVRIQVFREEDRFRHQKEQKAVVELVTLLEDFQWNSIIQ